MVACSVVPFAAALILGILLRMTREDEPDPLWSVPIVLAATPIGNLGDATTRLAELIRTAEVIACEDTRNTRRLIQALHLSTSATLISLHEHNEASRAEELIDRARSGTRILVVSDAGMPTVSDPGFRLVTAAIQAGIDVTAAPGASAVTTALALSGLATDRFSFGGFLPRKKSERDKLITRLRGEEWTTVLFESPHRITASTAELAATLGGERRAAIARELTKRYEEVLRGSLGDLAQVLADRQTGTVPGSLKGEFVLVLAGAEPGAAAGREALSLEDAARIVLKRAGSGEKLKTVAKELGADYGYSARDLYDAALVLRDRA